MLRMTGGCTKWNVMVKDVAELPHIINKAFEIATTGRPGPVLVDLPKDISTAVLRKALPFSVTTPRIRSAALLHNVSTKSLPASSPSPIANAASLINRAHRPIIYAGHGIISSPLGPDLLRTLSNQGNIPVTTSLHGLGAFDETDEKKSLHMVGMHGAAYANMAIQTADVVVVLGARFDEKVTGEIGGACSFS